eukprot:1864061-Amphidinium_carterae.1
MRDLEHLPDEIGFGRQRISDMLFQTHSFPLPLLPNLTISATEDRRKRIVWECYVCWYLPRGGPVVSCRAGGNRQ